MISKLVVTFEKSELTKYEETSKLNLLSTWKDFKVFRTEEYLKF